MTQSLAALHIFRAGRHIASNGAEISFTESDLAATARAYDAAKLEAPLVIGHPKTDDPAFGWVRSLAFSGGELRAEPHQVLPAFAEMVNGGRFKKRSAAFYPPQHPRNPVPGVYYLKHVGFLGAAAPAVQGMPDYKFAAEDGLIEFADWADTQNASLWRRLRDWMIGKEGLDAANKAIPDYLLQTLEDSARTPSPEATSAASPTYAEQSPTGVSMTPEQIAAREAQLLATTTEQARIAAEQAARTAEFAERERRILDAEALHVRTEIAEFVGGLVTEGKVLPVHQPGLIGFMAGLAGDQVVEFGEGDKAVKKPGAAWLREYLTAQPKAVEFAEIASNTGAAPLDTGDAGAIARAAVEFQEAEAKAGRQISVTAAVTHVTQGAK